MATVASIGKCLRGKGLLKVRAQKLVLDMRSHERMASRMTDVTKSLEIARVVVALLLDGFRVMHLQASTLPRWSATVQASIAVTVENLVAKLDRGACPRRELFVGNEDVLA